MKKKFVICTCLLLMVAGSLWAQKMGMKKPALQTGEVDRTVMELAPNPANDWVDIRLKLPDTRGFTLEVFNERGVRMISKAWTGDRISMAQLPPGLYVCRLKRNKEVYSQKLVVER